MLNCATNETACTTVRLEYFINNDQQFNRHDFDESFYLGPRSILAHALSWPTLLDRLTINAIFVFLNLSM